MNILQIGKNYMRNQTQKIEKRGKVVVVAQAPNLGNRRLRKIAEARKKQQLKKYK